MSDGLRTKYPLLHLLVSVTIMLAMCAFPFVMVWKVSAHKTLTEVPHE